LPDWTGEAASKGKVSLGEKKEKKNYRFFTGWGADVLAGRQWRKQMGTNASGTVNNSNTLMLKTLRFL
jgi:hypothetical protein